MRTKVLPDWAKKMTNAEWENEKKTETGIALRNCAVCGQRLLLTLCKYEESKYYCPKHCSEHKWQTDYDWPKECARCGIHYPRYLESLLIKHHIKF